MRSKKLVSFLIATIPLTFITSCNNIKKLDGAFVCSDTKLKRRDTYEYNQKKKVVTFVSAGDEVINLKIPVSVINSKVMWRIEDFSFTLDRDTMKLKTATDLADGTYGGAYQKCDWIENGKGV